MKRFIKKFFGILGYEVKRINRGGEGLKIYYKIPNLKRFIKKFFGILGYEVKRINRESEDPKIYYKIPNLKCDERKLFLDEYEIYAQNSSSNLHRSGSFSNKILKEIERILPPHVENSAETGCGKSTILFSNISNNHTVFTVDDSEYENSSIKFFTECPLTNMHKIKTVFGSTQQTLKEYSEHTMYDVVLLDGPHGYPFPDFEYLIFYPLIKENGYLIIDDIQIPTIGRMADIIAEDLMWDLIAIIETTAIFQRTKEETFNDKEDGWFEQMYNRRRSPWYKEIYINDGKKVLNRISSIYIK